MKTPSFVKLVIPYDAELIINTKSIRGLIKTESRQDVNANSLIIGLAFSTNEYRDTWVSEQPQRVKEYIVNE